MSAMGGAAMIVDGAAVVPEGATPAGPVGEEPEPGGLLPPTGVTQSSEVVPGAVEKIEAVEAVGAAGAAAVVGMSAEQLGRLRGVLIAAHPEAVPELIAGGTFEELLGSVAGARAAFTRVRDEAARALAAGVPRGGGTREIDPAIFAGLSPEGKIAVGLQRK